jgi:hypothetical protein
MRTRFLRATGSALALAALVATGCARVSGVTSSPTPDDGIAHPMGSDDLVLRIEFVGGFVPEVWALSSLPTVSLYGDGRVITEGPQIEIYPGPALPNLMLRDLTEEGVQAVLEAAREAGLSGPDRRFDNDLVVDAHTTVFTVVTDDGRHVTSAYGLGIGGGPEGPQEDQQALRRLSRFLEDMTNLPAWLPDGSVGEERAYGASGIRMLVSGDGPTRDEAVEQKPVDWPLDEPLASILQPVKNSSYSCAAVEGDQADRVLAAAREANELTPWRSDGHLYGIVFRPLLPDERECEGVGF